MSVKTIIAGEFVQPMYEKACKDALTLLGWRTSVFEWFHYFEGIIGKIQHKYSLKGPHVSRLNRDLLTRVLDEKPDILLVWLGIHVERDTLETIKRNSNVILVSYVHDDPFAYKLSRYTPKHFPWHWRIFNESVPFYDVHFFSKQINVDEAKILGAREAHVLMQYFVPEIHHPVDLCQNEADRYDSDVVFVGHYEPDGREKYIMALVEAGFKVRIFGNKYWNTMSPRSIRMHFGEIKEVRGVEYTKALSGAKFCLNFLSRMNRDSYTTRCFEIPACGRLLLSKSTDDLKKIYIENEEAVFFDTPNDLVKKALWLRDHPEKIDRIAEAGRKKVNDAGHSVIDRMKQFKQNLERHLGR